ncbi:MAG: hypothetical protein FD123_1469 [Bacteroidetes bacterium]|nr:MAG: hypothetical protein FD123_1469 [Bacteroidota bacterium]
MNLRLLFVSVILFCSPALFGQAMLLVKTSLQREIGPDKKTVSETCFVDFEKRAAFPFVVDSVKSTTGKKIEFEFFHVEMIMQKDDIEWKLSKDFPADKMGLFQLQIKKSSGDQKQPAVNAKIDLTKGFVIYAHDNGKPVQLKVEKIDHLPDAEKK